MTTPLAWFGLPDDADERELKRVYAKRLKETRPDVDPAAFQALRARYEAAQAWYRQAAHASAPTAETAPFPRTESASAPADEGTAPAPASTWRAVQFDDASPTPDAGPFDAEGFAAAFFQAAATRDAPALLGWLQEQPELWSLRAKQQAGHVVLRRLFRDQPPMPAASFDNTLQFFGMDHALAGVDPLQLQQLRTNLDEWHALQQRFEPAIEAWNTSSPPVDAETVYRWFCACARDHATEPAIAALHAQPALQSGDRRQQLAPQLLERVVSERPPMPAATAAALFGYFRLYELAHARGASLQDVPGQLEIRWLMLPENASRLALRVRDAKKPYGEVIRSSRHLRWVQRPFLWWWILLTAWVPGLPTALGLFLWRLSEGVPSRLPRTIDPALVRFCIATASRHVVAGPRVLVGAIRCGTLLVLGGVLDALWYVFLQKPYGEPGSPSLLISALVVTVAWAAYISFVALLIWQRRPEDPPQPRPLLRIAFVPAGCVAGVLLWFASGSNGLGLCVLLPTASLAYGRCRARNPLPPVGARTRGATIPDTLFYIGLFASMRWAPGMALVALATWGMDLWLQRSNLRWRPGARAATSPTGKA